MSRASKDSAASDIVSNTAVVPPPSGTAVSLLADAPLYLLPDGSRTPLRVMPQGAPLTFLEAAGGWYHVTFQDPQWGRRYGYVEARLVAATLTPVDLSIRRAASAQTPAGLSVTKSRATDAGTSNLEPMDLSVRPRTK